MVKVAKLTEDWNIFGTAAQLAFASHIKEREAAGNLSEQEIITALKYGPHLDDYVDLAGVIHEGVEIELETFFGKLPLPEESERLLGEEDALAEKLRWKFHDVLDPDKSRFELYTDKGVLIATWASSDSDTKRWSFAHKVQFSEIYGS